MIVKRVALFLVAAAIWCLPSGQVSAQACSPLQLCGTSGGDHRVSCPAGGGVLNCHLDCGTCIYGECHPGCSITSLPFEGAKAPSAAHWKAPV